MISICIPIYNFNVVNLVDELVKQGKTLSVPYEIILIDDCSSLKFKKINKQVCQSVKYISLNKT